MIIRAAISAALEDDRVVTAEDLAAKLLTALSLEESEPSTPMGSVRLQEADTLELTIGDTGYTVRLDAGPDYLMDLWVRYERP